MEKSIELFAENGFEATSVQQITERCGISKGAFYLHFKSKDELINSLIDQFMRNLITDIEQAVSDKNPSENLLYNLFYAPFKALDGQANTAKIFLKEQVFAFNKELFERMQMYMTIVNRITFTIVQKQYPDVNPNMYLDIVFTINGLMKSYSELFLLDNYKVDVDQLCKALVEKVSIIAEHSTIQIISPDYLSSIKQNPMFSKEQLIELLDEKQKEIEYDSVVQDSLMLLKENLIDPQLNEVLIKGLVKNIRENDQCKWVAYHYQQYIEHCSL